MHVYGQLIPTYIKEKDENEEKHGGRKDAQHVGFGRRLMEHAEKLALQHGKQKIAVIAGNGTRNYYRRLGYILNEQGTSGFLIKRLYSSGEKLLYTLMKISTVIIFIVILYFGVGIKDVNVLRWSWNS